MRFQRFFAGAMLTVLLAGCLPQQASVESESETAAALFAENCAACHGADARGAGALAQGLELAVPDLTLLAARNGGEFPLVAVMAKIDGYTRGERGGAMMPEFGALLEGDRVLVDTGDGVLTPTPERLVLLAEYLRGMQQ